MKIRGSLIDLLTDINPEYRDYVITEGNSKILYVKMLKALYGMLRSSILYYNKFRKDVESIGYVINPYDICVANKIVKGHQHTIIWHVDDVMGSHVDPSVNSAFAAWCDKLYGSKELGHVKIKRGKVHEYLGMVLDFSKKQKLKIDMQYYIDSMVESFPYEIKDQAYPWNANLFRIDNKVEELDAEKSKLLHTFVMKMMFLCKRGRPDIEPAISFLSSRVTSPVIGDWNKMLRVMGYLKATKEIILTIETNNEKQLTWYVDAAFAVHDKMKSQTGAMLTTGKGMILCSSTKQKNNSRSSTEAELNGLDDKVAKILWCKLFLDSQGVESVTKIMQDNQSTIKLTLNGKESSGKRTRHFDIKLFYINDLIERKLMELEYCSTDDMVADYMTKPLTGKKFLLFRDQILNCNKKAYLMTDEQKECVGEMHYKYPRHLSDGGKD
jgi:hypothetical protein